MSNTIKQRVIERIDQLLVKAKMVQATHTPNSPNVIGFPTLDNNAFFEWKSNAENLIIKSAGENSSYHKSFTEHVERGYRDQVESGIGILRALKEDLELGFLSEVKDLVLTEVFTDFLDIAKHLLDNGYKDPAASLVGAVLEDGLRKIAEKNNVSIKGCSDIGSLNTRIADAEVYNRLMQKQVQAWKAIRDSADHGRFSEYNLDDVKAKLDGVGRFLSENL